MKVVHFADLHLDAQFAWLAAAPELARERRQSLRDTLLAIIELVGEVKADALLCGGDLFEHERVTPDTEAFLRNAFASIDPVRVFIAPGNHDWYGPKSLYSQVSWSPNVHIFTSPQLEPVNLADGLTLWGAAHCAPANTDDFLNRFRADRAGVNVGLFHGSERSWLTAQGQGKPPHAPFGAQEIPAAGLAFAFLGHFHVPKDTPYFSYPGNPDPLEFGESGDRGAIVAALDSNGVEILEHRNVARARVTDLSVDISQCTSQQDVRELLASATRGTGAGCFVRVTLNGEVAPSMDLRLKELLSDPRIQLQRGTLRTGYNLDAIRQEQTIRGQFVRDVENASSLSEDQCRRIIDTGLRALDGRADLEVV